MRSVEERHLDLGRPGVGLVEPVGRDGGLGVGHGVNIPPMDVPGRGGRTTTMAAMHHVPAEAETDLLRIAAESPFGSVGPMPEAAAVDRPLVRLDGVTKSFARRGRRCGRWPASTSPSSGASSSASSARAAAASRPCCGWSAGCSRPTAARSPWRASRPPSPAGPSGFGFVPQTPALLPWRTVRQNARLLTQVNRGGRGEGRAASATTTPLALLGEVGLGDFLDAYPRELSGGMQQRVALVRAFALGAPILLMDEPFAALDEMTRAEMRYLLLGLWERHEATVLFVTHSIAEAVMLSDRVAVLTPGRAARGRRGGHPPPAPPRRAGGDCGVPRARNPDPPVVPRQRQPVGDVGGVPLRRPLASPGRPGARRLDLLRLLAPLATLSMAHAPRAGGLRPMSTRSVGAIAALTAALTSPPPVAATTRPPAAPQPAPVAPQPRAPPPAPRRRLASSARSPAPASPPTAAPPTRRPAPSPYLSSFDFAATPSIVDVVMAERRATSTDLPRRGPEVELLDRQYPIVAANQAQFSPADVDRVLRSPIQDGPLARRCDDGKTNINALLVGRRRHQPRRPTSRARRSA